MSAKMAIAGAAIGAALGTATAAFANLARQSINTADEISKAAVKIGIGTEELSRLRYAADLSGVSFEGLQKGLLVLNRNMAGIGGESGKVAAAFAQMGIETRNADGSLKSSTQVLKEMADVFARMPDGAQKSALAMAVLGKSGADMIPLINGGSAALQELTDEADRFGIVIDDETGRKAEAFNDNLTRLQGVFGALATQVAAEMLPALVNLTDFLVRNAGQVRDSAKAVIDFGRGLGVLAGHANTLAIEFNQRFGPAVEWARQRLGALYQAATAILNPLGFAIEKIRQLGAVSGGNNPFGGMVTAMRDMGTQAIRNARALQSVGVAASGASGSINEAGGAARGAGAAFRGMTSDADEAARKLQGLMDRLFPAEAKARRLREELAIIDGSNQPDERKAAARFRLGTEGLGPARVSPWLTENDPLVDLKKSTIDLGEETEVVTVSIARSFADMSRSITSSLQGLTNSIRSGDFPGIIGGLLDAFTQLAGAGVFGSKLAGRINAPRSFDGGGFTGMGSRTGGLDGKGGFLAMLHPRESVIDHTKRQSGPMNITVTPSPYFDVRVDERISGAAPSIASAGASMAVGQIRKMQSRSLS